MPYHCLAKVSTTRYAMLVGTHTTSSFVNSYPQSLVIALVILGLMCSYSIQFNDIRIDVHRIPKRIQRACVIAAVLELFFAHVMFRSIRTLSMHPGSSAVRLHLDRPRLRRLLLCPCRRDDGCYAGYCKAERC